jgi:hypothetical protein
LPDHLPEGEALLWQGRPKWTLLAVNAFHVRKVAIYFAALVVGQTLYHMAHGQSFASAVRAVPVLALLALAACGILLVMAYAAASTTHYSLTNKRLLMKVGMALPVIINIPYRQVDGVSFATTSGNCGNIVFKIAGNTRLAYLLLWPHARPWYVTRPQPALRDIPDVEGVAAKLALALGGQMPLAEAARISPGADLVAAE